MKYGLKSHTIEQITDVFSRYPQVQKAVLYGSRAKGTYRDGSDIDISLEGSALNLRLLAKIENELDDLLLPYKIDLSIYDKIANSDLLDHIERAGKTIYQKNRTTSSV